jgi:hypothetical protein
MGFDKVFAMLSLLDFCREVLSSDIVHVRRPSMQGLDAWLHVNPQGVEKVSFVVSHLIKRKCQEILTA